MAEDKDKDKDLKSQLSEAMKKVAITGLGAIFFTEETVRNYLSELKLPKEMLNSFLENADKTKKEFLTALAKEMAQTISKIDMQKELEKMLATQKLNIKLEVNLSPKEKED
ncbi:MAG: hypothetical protein AB7F43_07320 [Bacteriovoracia bacterium]